MPPTGVLVNAGIADELRAAAGKLLCKSVGFGQRSICCRGQYPDGNFGRRTLHQCGGTAYLAIGVVGAAKHDKVNAIGAGRNQKLSLLVQLCTRDSHGVLGLMTAKCARKIRGVWGNADHVEKIDNACDIELCAERHQVLCRYALRCNAGKDWNTAADVLSVEA